MNPVRLERNEAKGEVATVMLLPYSSGPLVAGTITDMLLPRDMEGLQRVGFYLRVPVLESSAWEWYTTQFKVDLSQGVVR